MIDACMKVTTYNVNGVNGRLTLVEHEPTGGPTPRNFTVEPTGRVVGVPSPSCVKLVKGHFSCLLYPAGAVWHMGNPNSGRYNHVMAPNTWSCMEGSANTNGAMTASSRHPGVVNLVMTDGSVRAVKSSIAVTVWGAIGSRDGGETVSSDAL